MEEICLFERVCKVQCNNGVWIESRTSLLAMGGSVDVYVIHEIYEV